MPFLAGQQAWNRGKTKENDPRVRKISETFKAKRIDNFAQWRLRARLDGRIPATHLPLERTEQLAFLIGLVLGDGHIGKFPRSEVLRIVLGTDKPLLWQHVAKVVEQVFSKSDCRIGFAPIAGISLLVSRDYLKRRGSIRFISQRTHIISVSATGILRC